MTAPRRPRTAAPSRGPSPPPHARRRWVLGAARSPTALLLLAACSSPPVVASPPAAVASPSAIASTTAPPRESPRRTDPRWILAADEDPLEKARLAVAVGAAGLLDGVADGGEIAAVALAALPYADDGEAVLGRLAEMLQRGGPPRRSVLTAILGIAGQPRRQREALDPDGVLRCAEVLLAMVADGAAPPDERSLALSAARALAEHGYVDRARLPP